MTSKTSISSPSEKLSSDKCNSSTSFTDVTLSKITLRTQKSKRESKKRRLAIVCEEAYSQNDSFSFPNDENILLKETNLNSETVGKRKKNMNADEIFFKRGMENTGLEAQVKDYYTSSKDEQQINENTDNSSCKKLKKHKKHKNKSCLAIVCEEADSQNDSFSFPNEENILHKEYSSSKHEQQINANTDNSSHKKRKKHKKQSGLAIVCEEADSQNDSFSFPNEENILLKETNLYSGNVAKNKKNMKADEIVFKRCIENTGLEAQVKDYYSSSKDDQQINENTDSSFHKKLKKHKKHKDLDSFIEPKNDTVMSSRNSNEKTKQSIKHKNKTVGVILNKSDEEKAACKMYSPGDTPKDGKPVQRKLYLSQSYLDHNTEHTISDDSDATYCSTKSLDKGLNKKFKRKFRPNSNEPKTSYFCRENNVDDCMLGENEQPTHFQNQESAKFSESIFGPTMENHASLNVSSNWVSTKNKNSHISKGDASSPDSNRSPGTKHQENETQTSQRVLSNTSVKSNKKPKKRRLTSSNLEVNQLSTTLNENYHCDVNKSNTSKEALVEPCQKYKLSMSSTEFFDKTSTTIGKFSNDLDEYELSQNLPKTKAKQKTLEMRNKFSIKKITTVKKKAKINKSKNFKAINTSNSAILDVDQNEKDLITEALNKVSSKSVKNDESIPAEGGRINIKPNDTPSVVRISPTTKQKVQSPKPKANILLNDSSCGNFDKNKVQRDLLAAALKSISSKKSSISNRNNPSSYDSNQSPGRKSQENKTQISPGVLVNTSISIKKPKKRRQSSSNFEVNQLSTTLNENYHCDVNQRNRSEEALIEPCQKYNLSMSSAEVFDKTSTTTLSSKAVKNNYLLNESIHADSTTIGQFSNDLDEYDLPQNLPKTKAKRKTLEMRNEFCIKKITTDEEKTKINKSNNFKDINISNSAILDVGQNEKDLITEALNKVSSKSVKNNESIHAKGGRINIKPNDSHSAVKINQTTKQKVKHSKAKILLNESSCDIDKVQRDLLAAALKSINKSPKSHKTIRSDKNVKERKHKKPIKEAKKEEKQTISKIIHESAKESNSAFQPKIVQSSNMTYQALSQPCTSENLASIGKVKSDKNPKTEKTKSKLNQNEAIDIKKFQRQLLAAALKKVKSVPIESQTSLNPELHQGSKIKPSKEEKQAKATKEEKQAKTTKEEKQANPTIEEKQAKGNEIITKRVKKVKEKNKTGLKNKLKAKLVRDPFEDFTAKLLSAELEKRKKGLINT